MLGTHPKPETTQMRTVENQAGGTPLRWDHRIKLFIYGVFK